MPRELDSVARMCTRVLWNDNSLAVLTGRTMDWPVTTEPKLVLFPRGRHRDGGLVGTERISSDALTWTSRYASLVTSIYDVGTIDGFNEAGLSGHLLYLMETELPSGGDLPTLQITLWLQYVLDLAADVDEARVLIEGVRPLMAQSHGFDATVHLALEDASGNSLIAEFIGGELVLHVGREYTIMTNSPTFDEQLALLAQHDFSKPGPNVPVPGNINAADRFQRAAYYAAQMPEPTSEREAVAHVLAVVRNASVPFGAPYGEFGLYNTEYRTVVDVTNLRYFFELTTSPNVIWLTMGDLALDEGSPALMLDPYDPELVGDVTGRLAPFDPPY
jgi:penicillin V acylase-like amidase (Ntn superfamily)